MRLRLALCLLFLFLVVPSARADPFTYDLNIVFTNGDVVSGQIFGGDFLNNSYVASDLVSSGAFPGAFSSIDILSPGYHGDYNWYASSGNLLLDVAFNDVADQIVVCSMASPCTLAAEADPGYTRLFSSEVYTEAEYGSVVIEQTPEPASITLLATGALGLAGVLRRRIA